MINMCEWRATVWLILWLLDISIWSHCCSAARSSKQAENTHLLCKGKYRCTADLLFDWFGFDQTCKSDIFIWSYCCSTARVSKKPQMQSGGKPKPLTKVVPIKFRFSIRSHFRMKATLNQRETRMLSAKSDLLPML